MRLAQQVVETAESLPGKYRQVDLARMFAVSRERIRQIVDHEELADKVRKYCTLTFNCYMCGKEVKRKPSEFKRATRHFCSRRCLGRYNGRHYGFGATKVRRQALPGETRVLGSLSPNSLNIFSSPPVSGALGVIGLSGGA